MFGVPPRGSRGTKWPRDSDAALGRRREVVTARCGWSLAWVVGANGLAFGSGRDPIRLFRAHHTDYIVMSWKVRRQRCPCDDDKRVLLAR